MKDDSGTYLANILFEGEKSEHEEEQGRIVLHENAFNKDIQISEVYEIALPRAVDAERLPALRSAARRSRDASCAEPVFVVFNPHSGKGRGAQFIQPVLEHLAPAGELEHGLTQAPGDEARLASEAIARGFRRIVAVGGDGTWSNVGNAILRSGVKRRARARAGRHRLRPRQDARHPAARRRGLLPDRAAPATRARSTWAGSRTATS